MHETLWTRIQSSRKPQGEWTGSQQNNKTDLVFYPINHVETQLELQTLKIKETQLWIPIQSQKGTNFRFQWSNWATKEAALSPKKSKPLISVKHWNISHVKTHPQFHSSKETQFPQKGFILEKKNKGIKTQQIEREKWEWSKPRSHFKKRKGIENPINVESSLNEEWALYTHKIELNENRKQNPTHQITLFFLSDSDS